MVIRSPSYFHLYNSMSSDTLNIWPHDNISFTFSDQKLLNQLPAGRLGTSINLIHNIITIGRSTWCMCTYSSWQLNFDFETTYFILVSAFYEWILVALGVRLCLFILVSEWENICNNIYGICVFWCHCSSNSRCLSNLERTECA